MSIPTIRNLTTLSRVLKEPTITFRCTATPCRGESETCELSGPDTVGALICWVEKHHGNGAQLKVEPLDRSGRPLFEEPTEESRRDESDLAQDPFVDLVAVLTGLSETVVNERMNAAHGRTLMKNVFPELVIADAPRESPTRKLGEACVCRTRPPSLPASSPSSVLWPTNPALTAGVPIPAPASVVAIE